MDNRYSDRCRGDNWNAMRSRGDDRHPMGLRSNDRYRDWVWNDNRQRMWVRKQARFGADDGRRLDKGSVLTRSGIDGLALVGDGGLEAVDVSHVAHNLVFRSQVGEEEGLIFLKSKQSFKTCL